MREALRTVWPVSGLLAGELLLARVSSGPLDLFDCVLETLIAAGLVFVCVLVTRRWGRRAGAIAVQGVSALVVLGLLLPVLGRTWGGLLVVAVATLGLPGLLGWLAERLGKRWAGGAALVGPLMAMLGIWLLVDDRAPPLELLIAGCLIWLVPAGLGLWRPIAGVLVSVGGLALLLVPASAPSGSSGQRAHGDGPDVVLLTVDTLRADEARRLSVYRELASSGLEFTQAQSTSPWTLPALATLMTGQPASEHGAHAPLRGLPVGVDEGVPLLAERFREAGYSTLAVIGPNGFAGPKFGFQRGFDVFDHAMSRQRHGLPRAFRRSIARPMVANLLLRLGWLGRTPTYDAREVVERGLDAVAREEGPLFLWLHLMDAHLPYRHADTSGLPLLTRLALDAGGRGTLHGDASWATEEGRGALLTAYRHELDHVDRALRVLLERLGPPSERGRITVLTADHGEEFFEHGGLEHGHAFWREVLDVPLVIQGLGTGRIEEPVSLQDVAPTLLGAAGLPIGELSGRDLAVRPIAPRTLHGENLLHGRDADAYSVRSGDWKLITQSGRRLYDLDADPSEHVDRSAAEPSRVEALQALRPRPPRPGTTAELEETERALLEALGYLFMDESP